MNDAITRPWLAAILSLIFPGLGHVYAGRARRGLGLLAVVYGLLLAIGLSGLASSLPGFYLLIFVTFLGFGYLILDAYLLARRQNPRIPKKYNHLGVYVSFALVMVLVQWAQLAFRGDVMGFESFRLASNSMNPLLREGDYVVVDTHYFLRKQAAIGDVAVFRSVEEPGQVYVKRIAGFGGDRIAIRDGQVIRNGKMSLTLEVPPTRRQREISRSMETLDVPEDHLFMLGDWRDNSRDSRFWGTVPEQNLLGQCDLVFP
ncbi:MAG: signal peptidase I [Gammaproteobacteria bacterium]|nr:signal peptidase I [Gammaproteobacteria bacterium]